MFTAVSSSSIHHCHRFELFRASIFEQFGFIFELFGAFVPPSVVEWSLFRGRGKRGRGVSRLKEEDETRAEEGEPAVT